MEKPKHKNPDEKHEAILLEWQAPEFVRYHRPKSWFIAAGIAILSLIAYAVYTNSATMAIVFLVLAGVYYLTHNQEPRLLDVQITELGIHVGDKFYPYNAIESYWVIYDKDYVRALHLKLVKKGVLTVQLHKQNPAEVRRLLSAEIEENKGGREPLIDIFTRITRL